MKQKILKTLATATLVALGVLGLLAYFDLLVK
jgi:hypothetical protein